MQAVDVLKFWFGELQPSQWFASDPELDRVIRQKFDATLESAAQCELDAWRTNPAGRLAEIIVLDQFSRNCYRGTARSFAQDPLALALAQEAVAQSSLPLLAEQERAFLLMPYMHSESARIHQVATGLFKKWTAPLNYDFEVRHKDIIERFGRYPHRNAILGRESTPLEVEFLKEPGSSF